MANRAVAAGRDQKCPPTAVGLRVTELWLLYADYWARLGGACGGPAEVLAGARALPVSAPPAVCQLRQLIAPTGTGMGGGKDRTLTEPGI